MGHGKLFHKRTTDLLAVTRVTTAKIVELISQNHDLNFNSIFPNISKVLIALRIVIFREPSKNVIKILFETLLRQPGYGCNPGYRQWEMMASMIS